MRIERIHTTSKFNKRYRKLADKVKEVAKEKETLFRNNPFHSGLATHKLHGKDAGAWAFSVDRKYRIKFMFPSASSVLFLDIGTHDDVYR